MRSLIWVVAIALTTGCISDTTKKASPVYVPLACEPTIEQVLIDLEIAIDGTLVPCWMRRAASARRVGSILRQELEAK